MSPIAATKISRQRAGQVHRTSPIVITAALSIAGLIVAAGFSVGNSMPKKQLIDIPSREPIAPRAYLSVHDSNGNGTPDWQDELAASGVVVATSTGEKDTDPAIMMSDAVAGALYGGYLTLKQHGAYTSAQGDELAQNVAANIKAPPTEPPLTVGDITTRPNSQTATLEYRSELRTALSPMVTDDPPELDYYAQYVSTKDPSWLSKLDDAAKRYRAARNNMLAVAAPEDAVPEHLRALNALGAYAETLERLSRNAPDTFAALALLKTMNESEEEMLAAFDALSHYYVRTVAQN